MKIGNNYAFDKIGKLDIETTDVATIKGIGLKTLLLLGITFFAAIFAICFINPTSSFAMILYFGITLVTVILNIIMCFKPTSCRTLSIPYALMEGLMLGVFTGILEVLLPQQGLMLSAAALIVTVGIFIAAVILYTTGVIRVGSFFRKFMFTALIGTVIASLALSFFGLILMLAGGGNIFTFIYSSPLGLIISIVMVILASLYVVISIDNANRIVEGRMDKTYEWLASYGILLNIIWLYMEVVRLLLILMSNRRD